MASIIQNFLIPQNIQSCQKSVNSSFQSLKSIENLLKNSPFQKYQKTWKKSSGNRNIKVSVYFESMQSLQAVAELCFDLEHSTISMEMIILRNSEYLRTRSKGKTSVFCRLLQKYNVHLAQQNVCFFMDTSNSKVAMRNTLLINTTCISSVEVKQLHELASKNFQLVKQQVIYLVECANQAFQWEIYTKDARYLEKIHMEMAETMRNRQLIALSHICFQDATNDAQNKYNKNKELINFLNCRQSMVNSTLKKRCFVGGQMGLFCNFLEPLYFSSSPLPLAKLQQDFTKQFDSLFYKFQARKLTNGDNPYLFNTILIKNQANVQLRDAHCEGGFSKIEIAEMEIAYTQSQNLVLELPKITSNSPKKSWADEYTSQEKQKIIYFPKIIAIKISKDEADYQKIKHEKVIVQNFRTTTSPFIIKYYNCTQKSFKYRQFLLMDYLGPNLTLSEYNTLHSTFSLHSKMHIFIHLANTLNFLEKLQVVHMDLSSHNVMVCRDLLIKVIDFGEAYHPSIDSDKTIKYLPGHTLPYCPPETFNCLKKYTSKSDSFSLGIILYRILFNDFPFTPTGELKQCFIDKSYLQRCMIAPERVSQYGYERQLLLLLQLIMRCLSPDVYLRPNAYWLYVILNKIFLSFK